MVSLVKCPADLNTLAPGKSIFLGGGITDCPDWQKDIGQHMASFNNTGRITLVDPRRANFDIKDESMSKAQIEWEFRHLLLTDLKLFWFCKETLCPITLWELAYTSQRGDDIVIGIEKGYQRAFDVREQLLHLRPDIHIDTNIYSLGESALSFLEKKYGTY